MADRNRTQQKHVGIVDIAREAGVSASTVSRVLNGVPLVKDSTRDLVLKIAKRKDFRLNTIASNLRQQRTASIGAILSNVQSPFYSYLAKAIEDVASKQSHSVILCNADNDPEKERRYLDVLLARRVDGLVISPTGKNRKSFEYLERVGIPFVFVDRIVPRVTADSVVTNNQDISREIVASAIRRGYRRIGCISGPTKYYTGYERLEGFREAFVNSGVPLDPELVFEGDFTYEEGQRLTRILLQRDIDALYVINEFMALGAFSVFREYSLRVPQDLGFFLFDDPVWARVAWDGITAVSQPIYEMGSLACDLLFKHIQGENTADSRFTTVLKSKIVFRPSL